MIDTDVFSQCSVMLITLDSTMTYVLAHRVKTQHKTYDVYRPTRALPESFDTFSNNLMLINLCNSRRIRPW